MIRQTVDKRTDVLTFGKFRGKNIFYILREDPSYILWLDKQEVVEFPEDIVEEAINSDFSYDDDFGNLDGGWDGDVQE